MKLSTILLVCILHLSPFVFSIKVNGEILKVSNNSSSVESLDAYLQESAFKSLVRHRPLTGALYTAPLPANLSGIEASIVRLRSRRLWNVGANFSHFQIPSRTKTTPHVKRLAIVYQDLGNWSSHYYNVPGYSMVTSVVGFSVFNASNSRTSAIRRISLDTMGKRVVVRFSNLRFLQAKAKCVSFGETRGFRLSKVDEGNVCYSEDQGHFAVVVPVEMGGETRAKKKLWYLWILSGLVIGLGGFCLIGYYVVVSMKFLKAQKIQTMEKQAEEDSVLENKWIGSSKMPFATITRTQPNIEAGAFP